MTRTIRIRDPNENVKPRPPMEPWEIRDMVFAREIAKMRLEALKRKAKEAKEAEEAEFRAADGKKAIDAAAERMIVTEEIGDQSFQCSARFQRQSQRQSQTQRQPPRHQRKREQAHNLEHNLEHNLAQDPTQKKALYHSLQKTRSKARRTRRIPKP